MRPCVGLLLGLGLSLSLNGCFGLLVGGALVAGAAGGASIVHDRRPATTILEDHNIAATIYNKFKRYPELSISTRANITVTSYNKVVLLTGQISTPEARQQAAEIARYVGQVKVVHNELTVAPPSSLESRAADAALTTQVKAALLQITRTPDLPDFDPTRVKVLTEQGIVYLFGLLQPQEAQAAAETVRQVARVQQVVTLFEYI